MKFIILKLILAFGISFLPFLYHLIVGKEKKGTKIWNKIILYVDTKAEIFGNLYHAIIEFLKRLSNGMKKYESFRKFFIFLTLINMLIVQFVDYQASEIISKIIIQTEEKDVYEILLAMVTLPGMALLSGAVTLSFFFYKNTDKILTYLHNNKKEYAFLSLIVLSVLFFTSRSIVFVETIYIVMVAAYFYPNRYSTIVPIGGTKIKYEYEEKKCA